MCSIALCLAFLLVQTIFIMHCRPHKTAEIMKDGRVSVKPEINVEEVLKKFSVKFYKKRFVEDQNLVVAPLLIFKVFRSLYGIMDASAKYDLHSLADIPHNASMEKMQEFETFTDHSLKVCITKQSQVVARLYYGKSIGQINSALKTIETVTTNFDEKQGFLKQVNDWIKNPQIRGTDDLVHDYDVNKKTEAFLAGAFSFDWPSQLKLANGEKTFQGEKVQFLEGNIRTSYAKLDHPKVEVVELKRDELPGIKLWLILPDKASSIKEFNDKLNVDIISQIESGLAKQIADVALILPRVSIEYNSQEDAYVMEVFEVFSSLFTTPSIKLAEGKEDLYPVKNFLMKCILRLNASETTIETKAQGGAKNLAFDRPFVLMMLTNNGSVPLMLANYFSPKDKLRELEEQERKLKALAQQHIDL
ncbi:uncharacterized protein LOC135710167 [Ochlerotatus camptorhynchus]|uniref:uncharacterized protein LOC135710167 n=1 Tax=Ochlerotatus camptorhynchus TaxID=644619 RepID=UPI0031CDE528